MTERTALDEHLDQAFAALDAVPVHELRSAGAALEKRDDWLSRFGRVLMSVAFARECETGNLRGARYMLTRAVEELDDEQAEQITSARAEFSQIVREAALARRDEDEN